MTKFFVLCDPNIVRTGGHYLEYAKMVLDGAQALGYQPVLAVNKNSQITPPEGWRVLKVFEFGFWGRYLGDRSAADQQMTPADRRYLRLKYSRYGLLWNAAATLGEVQHFNRGYPPSPRTIELLRRLHEIKSVTDLELRASSSQSGGSERPTEDWTPADREKFYRSQYSAIRNALRSLKSRSDGERTLLAATATAALANADVMRDLGALQDLTGMGRRAKSFADAMGYVLDAIRPGPDSVILYPTVNYFELRGLKEVLDTNPLSHFPSHHVILRRNAYNGYSSSFNEQEWQVHPIRTALALLNKTKADVRLRYYTDTEPLTHQYNLFNTARFVTGPVPVDMAVRACPVQPSFDTSAGCSLLFVDANGIEKVKGFLTSLDNETQGTGGQERLSVKIVVRDEPPLGHYLASGLAGTYPFGDVEFILPEDVDRLAENPADAVIFGSWHEGYSRIAIEAMERGQPVAAPATSWIAKAMCREAGSFHDEALRLAEVVKHEEGSSLNWGFYDYQTGTQTTARDCEWLSVHHTAATAVEIAVPVGVDTVRIQLRQTGPDAWKQPINLIAFFRSATNPDAELGRHDLALAGLGEITASIVLPVPQDGRRLALSLCNFRQETPISVQPVSVTWLNSGRAIPALPGGLTMPALDDDFVNAWLTPLRTLLASRRSYGESAAGWMEPVALRRRLPLSQRPMVASYIGDAREEKGFHRLPALVRQLKDDPTCDNVILKSQVYYTSDYPEASCLTAAAILRSLPRDRVTLIERPLNSREYAREILKSDAILIPYGHQEYIARSSGIFSEAMAGGIPVVIPSGTWMSGETDAMAYAQHSALISSDRLISPGNLDLHSYVGGVSRALEGTRQAQLPVTCGTVTFVHLPIPEDAEYVWVTYCPDPNYPRAFTRFDISCQDKFHGGAEVYKIKRVLGGGSASHLSMLAKLPKKANAVWIGIYNVNGLDSHKLRNFSLNFVRNNGPRIPEFVGGVTYFTGDSDAELDNNFANAVRLLRKDYDLYAASAAAIQPQWAARHSPSRLVSLMEMPFTATESRYRDRFSGMDW